MSAGCSAARPGSTATARVTCPAPSSRTWTPTWPACPAPGAGTRCRPPPTSRRRCAAPGSGTAARSSPTTMATRPPPRAPGGRCGTSATPGCRSSTVASAPGLRPGCPSRRTSAASRPETCPRYRATLRCWTRRGPPPPPPPARRPPPRRGGGAPPRASEAPPRLGRDQEVALHGRDPRRGRRGRLRGAGFLQGVHVSVESRGVVGHFHPDMARVDLRLALEGVLDGCLDALRAGRRADGDEVRHSDHPPEMADHPLDLAALESVLHFPLEGDPAGLHPGSDPAGGRPAGRAPEL